MILTKIKPPVDCDLLLRAAHAGLQFASTKKITVHKFAAGHRYLSYLRQTSHEQERMLRRMQKPNFEKYTERVSSTARTRPVATWSRDILISSDMSLASYPGRMLVGGRSQTGT